ncbi:MAG: 2-amino-4-hydroxy-6-hydroxymethyldihydropteridine diphosphokinase [Planctomycetota bacterium]
MSTSGRRFPRGRDARPGARLVLLGLGSNREPEAHIPRAVEELTYAYDLLFKSTRYVGPPEGLDGEEAAEAPPYSNVSVLIRTADTYDVLRGSLREIEAQLGRDRSQKGVVTIDIDILLIQGEVVRNDGGDVIVPHPDLAKKRHAAIPSAEVAPAMVLPHTGQRVAQLAAELA